MAGPAEVFTEASLFKQVGVKRSDSRVWSVGKIVDHRGDRQPVGIRCVA